MINQGIIPVTGIGAIFSIRKKVADLFTLLVAHPEMIPNLFNAVAMAKKNAK